MSFRQCIFMLLFIFLCDSPECESWRSHLHDDVISILSDEVFTYSEFSTLLLRKALPYSSKRIRFYNDFLKFVDKYLKL